MWQRCQNNILFLLCQSPILGCGVTQRGVFIPLGRGEGGARNERSTLISCATLAPTRCPQSRYYCFNALYARSVRNALKMMIVITIFTNPKNKDNVAA